MARVEDAVRRINMLSDDTGVEVLECNTENNCNVPPVVIRGGGGCSADIGFQNSRFFQQYMTLNGCSVGTIIHEFGHSMGLYHEQVRSDRDKYIKVNNNQLRSGTEINYDIVNSVLKQGVYDYGSIMHYPNCSFSKVSGCFGRFTCSNFNDPCVTIETPNNIRIGQRNNFSDGDIQSIAALYNNRNIAPNTPANLFTPDDEYTTDSMTITVRQRNSEGQERSSKDFGLLYNDGDFNGDISSIEIVVQPAEGTLRNLRNDGSFQFEFGPETTRDSFSYRVVDRRGNRSEPVVVVLETTAQQEMVECDEGFEADGDTCTDVNECTGNMNNCDENATCTNTPGSFSCACNEGFSGNGVTCTDIDECAANNGGCDQNATCTNTPGSFSCTCNEGFEGNGVTCTDIDDCLSNPCRNGGSCTDTGVNSFSCDCTDTGYTGETCQDDIDECAVNNGGCDQNATCTNTPGSFTCTCNEGFRGDGVSCEQILCEELNNPSNGTVQFSNGRQPGSIATYDCSEGFLRIGFDKRVCAGDGEWTGLAPTCEDIDDCLSNPCRNGGTCTDTGVNSFSCDCSDTGYTGETCQDDIDECSMGTHNCDQNATCTNTPGSFTCELVQCGDPPDIDNGSVSFTGNGIDDIAEYSCDFRLTLVGNNILTCTVNGTWGEPPTCEDLRNICPDLPDPANGFINFTFRVVNTDDTSARSGDLAQYGCNEGFQLVGFSTRVCDSDGRWSGTAPTCEDIDDCLSNPCRNGGTCTDTGVNSFECNCAGTGHTDNLCQTDINECELNSGICGENSFCTNTVGGFMCECNEGFEGDGVNCSPAPPPDGDIDACVNNPCDPNAVCTDLPDPAPDGPTGRRCDCNAGFAAEAVIDENSENVENEFVEIICRELICDRLEPPENGAIFPQTITGEEDGGGFEGVVASYLCEDGFELIGPDFERRCQEDGTWTGEAPECRQLEIVTEFFSARALGETFRIVQSPQEGACAGFGAEFNVVVRFMNESDGELIRNLAIEITTLGDGREIGNADDQRERGEGARLTVEERGEEYSDGELGPGESVDVDFVICLPDLSSFKMFVDVLGIVKEPG